MGYWLHQRWKEDTGIDEDVTSRYELPSKGILSAIKLRVWNERSATARSTSAALSQLPDEITKLEVIANGSKVIKSLTCNETLFSNLLDFKRPPYQQNTDEPGGGNIVNAYLNFGRYLRDPAYGLDCSKYDLLELKVTNAVSTTAGTGFTDGQLDYEIWLEKYVGTLPGRVGYFKTSQKKSYTSSGGSAWDEVSLPCLNPYRRVILRSWLTTKTPGEGITEVVFEVNEGEYTPFFDVPMRMCANDELMRGLDEHWEGESYTYTTAATYYIESPIPYPPWVTYSPKYHEAPEESYFLGADAGRVSIQQTGTTAHPGIIKVRGTGYQYCMSVPFDVPDIEESYFPTADLSKIKLKWKETTQKPVISVVLDELVKE